MINIINDFSFKFNSSVKLNFDGGDLVTTHGLASLVYMTGSCFFSFKIVIAASIEAAISIEKQQQILAAVWARQTEVRVIAHTSVCLLNLFVTAINKFSPLFFIV